jgi:hypothetical protein
LESARRSHVNQFLGPEPQAIYAAASKHAHSSPAQLGGNLGSYQRMKSAAYDTQVQKPRVSRTSSGN